MTDAELVEAAALERQVSELTRKNCELQEKLDEYENAYKFIVDDKCFNEEKHCACTPILRAKVKELEAENAMLKARLEPIEAAHREYEEYPSSAIVKRDAFDGAEGGGMIQIINVGGNPLGVSEYSLRINGQELCQFVHNRTKGLPQCLRTAAEAYERTKWTEAQKAMEGESPK
mgnify:CR=1 FL=1